MQAVLTSEAFAFIPEPVKVVPTFDIEDMMACVGVAKGGYENQTASEWLETCRGPIESMPEA